MAAIVIASRGAGAPSRTSTGMVGVTIEPSQINHPWELMLIHRRRTNQNLSNIAHITVMRDIPEKPDWSPGGVFAAYFGVRSFTLAWLFATAVSVAESLYRNLQMDYPAQAPDRRCARPLAKGIEGDEDCALTLVTCPAAPAVAITRALGVGEQPLPGATHARGRRNLTTYDTCHGWNL